MPLYPEDLEVAKDDRFCVQGVIDLQLHADVDSFIEEISNVILAAQDIAVCVVQNETFEAIYSLIK